MAGTISSVAELCNLALGNLGAAKEISVITERSAEAAACRRYYDVARDTCMRVSPWPFITRMETLGLVEENPTDEWRYSYRYPSDCVWVRRIASGIRWDTRQSRVPYRIYSDSAGKLIYTDETDAKIEYSVIVEDPTKWDADFVEALSWGLAYRIAPRVVSVNLSEVKQDAMATYDFLVKRAQATAFNEVQQEEQPDAEATRVRE